MSRIGKQSVKIPAGVKVVLAGKKLTVSGSSSSLSFDIRPEIEVEYDTGAGEIRVSRNGDDRFSRSMHGTTRALIANMIQGVTKGFQKKLEMYGTGYGVKQQGKELVLSVGFAKPVHLAIPDGVTVEIQTPNARGNDVPAVFIVQGPDKQVVGHFAAEIRGTRPPEPYLGKGIRYGDEVIRRKVGKAFGSGG